MRRSNSSGGDAEGGGGAGGGAAVCGLAGALAKALQERARAIQSSSESDDSENEASDFEWDDWLARARRFVYIPPRVKVCFFFLFFNFWFWNKIFLFFFFNCALVERFCMVIVILLLKKEINENDFMIKRELRIHVIIFIIENNV